MRTSEYEIVNARRDLAAALRWAARFGLSEGIDNHFSVLVPGRTDRFLLNQYGLHWSEATPGNLIMIDMEGRLIEGETPPEATALFIHSRIHRYSPGANCILHTHMSYATALTAIEGGRLENCVQTSLILHGQIAYDDHYTGLVMDTSEGDRLVEVLGSKKVLFLANHGVIVIGRTVAEAFDSLYYLERACRVQVLAMSTGRKLRIVPEEMAAHTAAQAAAYTSESRSHFDALKRILAKEDPEFAPRAPRLRAASAKERGKRKGRPAGARPGRRASRR